MDLAPARRVPKKAPQTPAKGRLGRQEYRTAYPTSPYRVFATLQEAEAAVEGVRGKGYPTARIADGFARRVKPVCLWLYQRPDSHPEGKTITVYAHIGPNLLYLRENGEFQ